MPGVDYYLTHSVHPSLWAGAMGAWLPSSGNTGNTIPCMVGSSSMCVMQGISGTQNNHYWATNTSARGGRQIVAQGIASTSYWRVPFRIGRVRQASISCWLGARQTETNGSITATTTNRNLITWWNNSLNAFSLVHNSNSGRLWTDGAWRGTANYIYAQDLHHYCFTWGPGKLITVYQDGLVIHSHTMTNTVPSNLTDNAILEVGNGFGGNGGVQWDDLRVYNRALSPREVSLLAERPGIAYQISPRRRGFSTVSGQTVSPVGIASTLGIGQPSVTTGAVTVSPNGIASTLAIGSPTVSAGALNIDATGIASTLAIGQPTVTAGAVTVTATGIASTLGIGQPTVTVGAVTVSPSGVASALALGQPTITVGVQVDATGIASTLAIGQPTVTAGAVTVTVTGIASTLAIGTPAVTTGVTVSPTGIASTLAVGSPTITTLTTVSPTGIASTLATGSPTVSTGDVSVSVTGIASSLAVGQPVVSLAGSAQNIATSGIGSTLAVGLPTITIGFRADSLFQGARHRTSAIVRRWEG